MRKQGWGGRVLVGLCCSWFVLVSSLPISGRIHRKLTDPVPEKYVHFVSCTNILPNMQKHVSNTPASTEGGAAITLHPSLGWLSPFTTEDQAEAEFPGSPRSRGSLAPRSGCRRLYAECVQSLPRPTTLLHLAAAGGVGACVHMSVCMCVSFHVPM